MSLWDPDLARQARQVLDRNWMGHATRPAPRLYPHQWSWDSAFIAIGYAHFDQPRARQELRSLFRGQWANGLLPHILFNPQATAYRPGPEFWQAERSPHAPARPKTSGIVQPPVHATAVWHIHQSATDPRAARAFLEEMFPRLRAWHNYLYRERDPEGIGLVYIRHPWESGQDNSPIWDRVLARIRPRPEEVPAYERVDTSLVAPEERPGKEEYDRYAYLVRLFYENDYDEARIRAASPFLVYDVLFNTLLVQAERDLANIARALGSDPQPFEDRARRTAAALNERLWDEEHAIFFDQDLVTGERIHAHVAAGFSPLFAGIPSPEQAQRMVRRLDTRAFCRLDEACWAVPSYDRDEPGFAPDRYWRGPVWININWLLCRGLERYGFHRYAQRVRQAICELPRRCGFYEYYDPDSGQGHGSPDFSWTAALLLDILYEAREG